MNTNTTDITALEIELAALRAAAPQYDPHAALCGANLGHAQRDIARIDERFADLERQAREFEESYQTPSARRHMEYRAEEIKSAVASARADRERAVAELEKWQKATDECAAKLPPVNPRIAELEAMVAQCRRGTHPELRDELLDARLRLNDCGNAALTARDALAAAERHAVEVEAAVATASGTMADVEAAHAAIEQCRARVAMTERVSVAAGAHVSQIEMRLRVAEHGDAVEVLARIDGEIAASLDAVKATEAALHAARTAHGAIEHRRRVAANRADKLAQGIRS